MLRLYVRARYYMGILYGANTIDDASQAWHDLSIANFDSGNAPWFCDCVHFLIDEVIDQKCRGEVYLRNSSGHISDHLPTSPTPSGWIQTLDHTPCAALGSVVAQRGQLGKAPRLRAVK